MALVTSASLASGPAWPPQGVSQHKSCIARALRHRPCLVAVLDARTHVCSHSIWAAAVEVYREEQLARSRKALEELAAIPQRKMQCKPMILKEH